MFKKLIDGAHFEGQESSPLFFPKATSSKLPYFKKGEQFKKFPHNNTFDNRPFIEVKILDHPIVGLLDSGSYITILGKKGVELIKYLNLNIFTSKTKFVFTADNTEQRITGLVHLPIVIDNECHIIEALTVPSL